MNMVEIAYQLKGFVDVIVGSEEVEPGNGWPYDTDLAVLAASPGAAAREVAPKLVANYVDSYRRSRESVTQSAVDVARVKGVAKAASALADACIPILDDPAGFAHITRAAKNAQRYQTKDFADLGDLSARLADGATTPQLGHAAKAMHDALVGASPFVLASGTDGAGVARSTGTAVYCPIAGDVHVAYDDLDFSRASTWGRFLTAYQKA
jgi:hypothetical protein